MNHAKTRVRYDPVMDPTVNGEKPSMLKSNGAAPGWALKIRRVAHEQATNNFTLHNIDDGHRHRGYEYESGNEPDRKSGYSTAIIS